MEVVKLRDEYIKLSQALKAAGLADSGCQVCHFGRGSEGQRTGRIPEREEATGRG